MIKLEAFDAWKVWAGLPGASMGHSDTRALTLRERLDAYGPDSFELVLLGASKDDWVQGRKDGTEHKRLDYLLGSVSPAKYEELMQAGAKIRDRGRKAPALSHRAPKRELESSEPAPMADVLGNIERAQRALGGAS